MKIIDGDALLKECIDNTCKVCSASNYGLISYKKCPQRGCGIANVIARIETAPAIMTLNKNEILSVEEFEIAKERINQGKGMI